MNKMNKISILSILLFTAANTPTFGWTNQYGEVKSNSLLRNYSYYVRGGYNLGGTAPIGMPATIRTLHSYSVRPNFILGFDAFHPFNELGNYVWPSL